MKIDETRNEFDSAHFSRPFVHFLALPEQPVGFRARLILDRRFLRADRMQRRREEGFAGREGRCERTMQEGAFYHSYRGPILEVSRGLRGSRSLGDGRVTSRRVRGCREERKKRWPGKEGKTKKKEPLVGWRRRGRSWMVFEECHVIIGPPFERPFRR